MSTRDLLENLAEAVEQLAGDHKERITRIEARRAHLAVKVERIMKPLSTIRNALDEFESQMRQEIESMVTLEDAELTETDGEAPEDERGLFHAMLTGKANGDDSRH
jgi:predicted nuclease with TOPRIM domain